MTKATVHKDKDTDSLTKAEVAAHGAFPEIFKAADPIIIQPKKPLSLETAGSELYAAIMNGEVQNVRGQLAHGDKVTEAEATMMIRVRNKAREKGAKRGQQIRECTVEKIKGKKKAAAYINQLLEISEPVRVGKTARIVISKAGTSLADIHGGRYTAGGYEMADGSYLSTGGEFFNAMNNILTLSDGKSYKLAADLLPTHMANVLNLANKVRAVRNSAPVTELDFLTDTPAAPSAETIAVVADAANLAAKSADAHAAEVMKEKAFQEESNKAPAAAIERLDGTPGLSAEDIHMAIQLHRRAISENRTIDMLTERDCQEIIDVRDGLACIDTSSMRRCHSRDHDHDSMSIRFNPVSREPAVIVAACEVGRSIKACFMRAGSDRPKASTPVHAKLALA